MRNCGAGILPAFVLVIVIDLIITYKQIALAASGIL